MRRSAGRVSPKPKSQVGQMGKNDGGAGGRPVACYMLLHNKGTPLNGDRAIHVNRMSLPPAFVNSPSMV